ncbi:MAG: GEVED domain-containing protein [Flavobacteriales bacterium]|nr:GEVED domain-containing protein [Flavobacteriales bacterium]MDW8432507.1 GEVED domain-containing protein [Flavobacteriales bacterium]
MYSVGSGGAFSSVTEALAQIEQRGLAGPVTLSLIDSVYAVSAFGGREVFPWVMGSATGGGHPLVIEAADTGYRQLRAYGVRFQNGSGSNQPVLYRVFSNTLAPLATTRSDGLVYLLGANYVTLRRFGFVAQTPLNWLERGVVIGASDGQDGAQYNVVEKWRLHFPDNTGLGALGLQLSRFFSPLSQQGTNSHNTFQDLEIRGALTAVYLAGDTLMPDEGNILGTSECARFNHFEFESQGSSNTYPDGFSALIWIVGGQKNFKMFNNRVGFWTLGWANSSASFIQQYAVRAERLEGLTEIYNNRVFSMGSRWNFPSRLFGFYIQSGVQPGNEVRFYNNMVGGLRTASQLTQNSLICGIHADALNADALHRIYNNTVGFRGATTYGTACLSLKNPSVHYDVRNNIFANAALKLAPAGRPHLCLLDSLGAFSSGNASADYNIYYVTDTVPGHYLCQSGNNLHAGLPAWQAASAGMDAHSVSGLPAFYNATDLHVLDSLCFATADPTVFTMVSEDADCQTRQPPPTAGADQPIPCGTWTDSLILSLPQAWGCTGGAIPLNSTLPPPALGLQYFWEFSNDTGASWNVFSNGAPPVSYVLGGEGLHFRLRAECSLSGQTSVSAPQYVEVFQTSCSCPSAYPIVAPTQADGEEIVQVSVGAMTNTSVCQDTAAGFLSQPGRYSNFTLVPGPSGLPGTFIPFTLWQQSCASVPQPNGFQLYVDWNEDGDFLDANERVFNQPQNVVGNHQQSGIFQIPYGVSPGSKRMRVVNIRKTFPTSINYAHSPAGFQYGEVEDYCFTVTPPIPCSAPPAGLDIAVSTTEFCLGQTLTFHLTDTLTIGGLSFKWQTLEAGDTIWQTFSQSPPPAYLPITSPEARLIRCVITCNHTGLSYSTPVKVLQPKGGCRCLNYSPFAPQYGQGEDIVEVHLGSMFNPSDCPDSLGGSTSLIGRYSDFAGLVPPAQTTPGDSLSFLLKNAACNGVLYPNGFLILVDWDEDGQFELDETVYTQPESALGPQELQGSFLTPFSVTAGIKRVRIINRRGYFPWSIQNTDYYYGETEDYCLKVLPIPVCSALEPVEIVSTPANVCYSSNLTLSLSPTAHIQFQNLQFRWEVSLDSGATWQTFALTYPPVQKFQIGPAWFRCTIRCAASGDSLVTPILKLPFHPNCSCLPYPVSEALNPTGSDILDVYFGETHVSTPCGQIVPGSENTLGQFTSYLDLTPPIQVEAGKSYLLTVKVGTCNYYVKAGVKVFMDWNQDLDFSDYGETLLAFGPTLLSPGILLSTGTVVTIPPDISVSSLRMRVVCKETEQLAYVSPVGYYTFGETEDYCIQVMNSVSAPTLPFVHEGDRAFLSGDFLNLILNGADGYGPLILSLFDMSGRQVMNHKMLYQGPGVYTAPMPDLSTGHYLLQWQYPGHAGRQKIQKIY